MKRVIALGFFDGVHLGHRALLKKARQQADLLGCTACALTFDRHPQEILSGRKGMLLNTRQDRERMLKQLGGMDEVLTLPFDGTMMCMPWEQFIEKILVEQYDAVSVVCGHDYTFGYKGEGNADCLRRYFGEHCHVIEPVTVDGQVVSSSAIRKLLQEGNIGQANRLLGHEHFLISTVVHGKHLGRKIGIPTANLYLPEEVMPPRYGVYVSRVEGLPAVTNIGIRPTLNDGQMPTVESWIIGFRGDLYGKELKVELVSYLRPETKFSSIARLKEQILLDGEEAKKLI